MMWQTIETEQDVAELMWAAEHFHDWEVMSIDYEAHARAVVENERHGDHYPWDTNAIIATFRYDTKDEDGNWPEIVLEFTGVSGTRFWVKDVDYLECCAIQKGKRGWVFSIDERSMDEAGLDDPLSGDALSWICADKIRWKIQIALGEQAARKGISE